MNQSVLDAICKKGQGEKYVELQNSVGQRWYIPLRNSSVHLSLFQPSSIQGKIVAYYTRKNRPIAILERVSRIC